MEFKYKRKTYIYDPVTGMVKTKKGNSARNQEAMLKHINYLIRAVQAKGFNFRMSYQEFDTYIGTLTGGAKEELFHNIYAHYLYANESLDKYHDNNFVKAQDKMTVDEYFKVMAKLKRYEQYLYKILMS